MSVSKTKNIIIAALVLVNLLFVAVIISDRISDAMYAEQAIESACIVLAENGIQISAEKIANNGSLKSMKTARGVAAEERIAEAILGTVTMPEQGGAIYRFENEENGTAVFYSGGEFSISLNDGVIRSENGAVSTVKKLLRNMNLEFMEIYVSDKLGLETITVVGAYKNSGIFNCTVRFIFSKSSLISVAGRCVTGVEPVEESVGISSPATALMNFYASVKRGEIDCSRIDGVETGYHFRETSAFGDGALIPVWLISADSGRYVVDTENNEIHVLPDL